MMSEKLDIAVLGCGLTVLAQPVENVASAAFTFALPCGAATLPENCCGAANVISDWLFRGAGDKNSRQLIEALDGLGVHRSTGITADHLSLSAALEAGNLLDALDIYTDIITRPALEHGQFELSKQLALHELASLDDDPRHKVMLRLYEQFYPYPLGLPPVGKFEDLANLSTQKTKDIITANFNLSDSILAVAGKYDFNALCSRLEKLMNSPPRQKSFAVTTGQRGKFYLHEQQDCAQLHIGLMTPAPPITSGDYYNTRLAVAVLSDGMSSRLFTEVREKRGLCYAVGARYHTLKNTAGISAYVGTTPDKAQQSLEIVIKEFNRLAEGISETELEKAKIGLKSSLIMNSESTFARAAGLASDYYLLGRIRPLDEIKQNIENTTTQSVVESLRKNPFSQYFCFTIGPKELKIQKSPDGI